MIWSFSKLQAYDTCPHMFRLNYIDKKPQLNNAFSQYGTFCHMLLEKHNKGELTIPQIQSLYDTEYANSVTEPFPNVPQNLSQRYFIQGKKYFASYQGFSPYKVLAVEKSFSLPLKNGDSFRGIIDLVLQEPNTNRIVIVDHKSKSSYGMNRDFDKYVKQLYIYALYIKEFYGSYPYKLVFNMFRDGSYISEIFSLERLNLVVSWLYSTIERVKKACTLGDFPLSPSPYFCQNVCSFRNICKPP